MHEMVIHNGTIVTVNSDSKIFENGIICIDAGKISFIGENKGTLPESREVFDLKGSLVMPGLINLHCHMPMTLFRGLADDLPLMTWLNEHIFPAEGTFINPETARAGSLLACAEMLLSGTTTVCDGYFHEEEAANAVFETGIKAVLGQGVIDFPAPGVPDPSKALEVVSEFVDKWKNVRNSIIPSIFCHSPYTCCEETLRNAKKLANEKGVLFQVHASETKFEFDNMVNEKGMSPIAYLNSIGVLDGRTLLHHSVWTDEKDFEILKRAGASVSHNPSSNMKLASGVMPANEYLKNNIPTGIGTDGAASNNTLDMFLEMDIAAKLHKVSTLDPTVLKAEEVLRMATIDGAKALGIDKETGSLEEGKAADLIIINMNKPHLTPCYHPASHLVYAVKGADVSHVMVDGKFMIEDRELKNVDIYKIMDDVKNIAKKINAGK